MSEEKKIVAFKTKHCGLDLITVTKTDIERHFIVLRTNLRSLSPARESFFQVKEIKKIRRNKARTKLQIVTKYGRTHGFSYNSRQNNEVSTFINKFKKCVKRDLAIEAKARAKAMERETDRDYESAIRIWEGLGEIKKAARIREITKARAKAMERETARDYESAIRIWEGLGEIKEAARVRELQADFGSVKVAQKIVHGDTIVKDSVLNRANVGGTSKMQELEKLTMMKEKGLISTGEYEKMKLEIIG